VSSLRCELAPAIHRPPPRALVVLMEVLATVAWNVAIQILADFALKSLKKLKPKGARS
jgi:hypothetical protein